MYRILLLSVLVVCFGCSGIAPFWNYVPPFSYEDQEQVSFKRYPKHMEYSLRYRLVRRAYTRNDEGLHWLLTPEQLELLKEEGQPEYYRSFLTMERETIEEWLYWKKAKIDQFRRGTLVYEGELTDLERVLLERGYPDVVQMMRHYGGARAYSFVYRQPAADLIVAFVGDKIVSRSEIK